MGYTSLVDNNTMKLLGLSGRPLIFKVTLIYGSTVVQLFLCGCPLVWKPGNDICTLVVSEEGQVYLLIEMR